MVDTADLSTTFQLPSLRSVLPDSLYRDMEASNEAVFSVDCELNVVCLNRVAERTFGVSKAELIGCSVLRMVPPRARVIHRDMLQDLFATWGSESRVPFRLSMPCQTLRGRKFSADVHLQMSDVSGQRLLIVTVIDRSDAERKIDYLENIFSSQRNLARRILDISEEERGHLARDVHDHLGQLTTALAMDFAMLKNELDGIGRDKQRLVKLLAHMDEMIEQTTEATRNLVNSLVPGAVRGLSICEGIESCLGRLPFKCLGIEVSIDFDERVENICDETIRASICRLIQEAGTNVVRHSAATNIEINCRLCRYLSDDTVPRSDPSDASCCGDGPECKGLDYIRECLVVVVKDNGKGFTVDPRVGAQGYGLRSMHERAIALGGRLYITSKIGQGTTITAQLPLEQDDYESGHRA